MKSKIIILAVAFVLGIASIAFSVRPSALPSGKGNGKNTSVSKPQDFAEIISSLPSASEYYMMAQKAASDKDSRSISAVDSSVTNEIRSISVYDDFTLSTYSSVSSNYSIGENEVYRKDNTKRVKQMQELVAYFTGEAVYYNIKATVLSRDKSYCWYIMDYGNHKSGETETTYSTTSTTIEAEYYLGVKGAFFKFNNYEIIKETVNYKNDSVVENDEDEDESLEKLAEKKALEAIRKNYGKWINAFYTSEYDAETPPENLDKMTEDDMLSAMAQVLCAQLSNTLLESLMDTTDTNVETLKKVAGVAALADEKSNAYYDKSGKLYTMTPFGRYTLLSLFGYSPSVNDYNNYGSEDGTLSYNSLTPVRNSSFILDLSNGEKPTWYLDFYFSTSNTSSSYSVSSSTDMHEDFYITNIDNTVAPNVSSTRSLYDFIGSQIKSVLKKQLEDN